MALSVLDGNQSATTLSSVVTGGEHIVAHSVVSLGANAISNITSAVSGSVVTIPNLAKVGNSVATDGVLDTTTNFIKIGGHQSGANQTAHIVHVSNGGAMSVDASGSSVTFSQASVTFGAITGSASILNFPSTQTIAGTVTANIDQLSLTNALDFFAVNYSEAFPVSLQSEISGTVTIGNSVTIGSLPVQLSTTTIGGTARLNVTLSSATTVGGTAPSYANLYGGSDGTNLRAISVDTSGRTVVTGSVSIASTTVTVSALPNGALTTRFGFVTTASVAQLTSCVTNTSRKYLLAQNISAGTVTIGIGFSPTTTQGIQLTAGAGLTFDAFCPTGAVYWLGAVTGAAFTILEG